MNYELTVIDHTSAYYLDVISLRNAVLRKPIGLELNQTDIADDKNQYILVALDNNKAIGCILLKVIDERTVKFRQMAIAPTYQKHGIGTSLLHYAENFCLMNDYTSVELHARLTALPFYKKNGYDEYGDEFMEVGIPHKKMIKHLEPLVL